MLRVLLGDDSYDFRKAFKESFSDHCPSTLIEEAGDGEDALGKIKRAPPHLIFMDIRMPGMSGLELTKKIKAETPNTPIAILTNHDLPEYKEAALQHGADRFFVKTSLQWDEVVAFAKSIPVEGKF